MPVMDGLEAAARIRRKPRFRDLPLIGLSASASDEDRDKGLASGMNDYLVKPVETDDLFSRHLPMGFRRQSGRASCGRRRKKIRPMPPVCLGLRTCPVSICKAPWKKYSDNQSFFMDLVPSIRKGIRGRAGSIETGGKAGGQGLDQGDTAQIARHFAYNKGQATVQARRGYPKRLSEQGHG